MYAAVEKDRQFLVLENNSGYRKYCFSGGGVDEGKDNVTVIKRELLEELNVIVDVEKKFGNYKIYVKAEIQRHRV